MVHFYFPRVVHFYFPFTLEEDDMNRKLNILNEARARADSHYTKTIHNLYTHYSKVTPELIERWISEGRIEEHSRRDLLRQVGERY